MEDQCEEPVNLAEQAEKQAASETEPLIELEEEIYVISVGLSTYGTYGHNGAYV